MNAKVYALEATNENGELKQNLICEVPNFTDAASAAQAYAIANGVKAFAVSRDYSVCIGFDCKGMILA